MNAPFHYKLVANNCWLSPHRMVFWEEGKALIVSDLHFGKTGHFRKSGIAVPQTVYREDLQRLVQQLQYFQPQKLVVVGDMFHSAANRELELFTKWRNDFAGIEISLVKGNHDILDNRWYQEAGIHLCETALTIGPFSFLHDIDQLPQAGMQVPPGSYSFTGHLHPGIRISGRGRQSLCFPCFYFTEQFCVLPAFSRFTGLAMVAPGSGDKVFAIVNQSIIPC